MFLHLAFTILSVHILDILSSILHSQSFSPCDGFCSLLLHGHCTDCYKELHLLNSQNVLRFRSLTRSIFWLCFGVRKCIWNLKALLHMPCLKSWSHYFSCQSPVWTPQFLPAPPTTPPKLTKFLRIASLRSYRDKETLHWA